MTETQQTEGKRCRDCGETRTADQFYPKRHAPDGLSERCRSCAANSRIKAAGQEQRLAALQQQRAA